MILPNTPSLLPVAHPEHRGAFKRKQKRERFNCFKQTNGFAQSTSSDSFGSGSMDLATVMAVMVVGAAPPSSSSSFSESSSILSKSLMATTSWGGGGGTVGAASIRQYSSSTWRFQEENKNMVLSEPIFKNDFANMSYHLLVGCLWHVVSERRRVRPYRLFFAFL